MAKPVLLTVDDDAAVLRAVERDLRKEYGAKYRVLRANSGAEALRALEQLKERNEPVALLLADQRMPEMTGVEFLTSAIKLFPDVKRVLLTAYADTTAAIEAINTVRINHYLLKPWDPPEENLYPVLNDLLEEWGGDYRPPFTGIRLVGHRWSPQAHDIKEFLGRRKISFDWIDITNREEDPDVRALIDGVGEKPLPLVVFPDGQRLSNPTTEQLAEKLHLSTAASTNFYDLAIVGAGPAGLAAAVYGASEGLKTLLIEREVPGGQAGQSSRIENYLGFPIGLSGSDLANRAVIQAQRFGVEILAPQEVRCMRADGTYRMVTLGNGTEISCNALLIATGLSWRKLDVPGVDRLHGAGVYYGAAMTEAMSCRDEDVYIVGGANSAGQAAMYFARYAKQVHMLVRADSLEKSMSHYLIQQIAEQPNIIVETRTVVKEAHGDENLTELTLLNHENSQERRVPASALFIFIGAEPRTDWLKDMVAMDTRGYVLSGPNLPREGTRVKNWPFDRDPYLLETSMPGVFVAGDTRHGSVKRVASGVGEGSICVQMVHQYLANIAETAAAAHGA